VRKIPETESMREIRARVKNKTMGEMEVVENCGNATFSQMKYGEFNS